MSDIKEILEYLYYASAPVIAFFAFRGLAQVRIMQKHTDEEKKATQMHAKRDAFKEAAVQCNYFLTHIIQKSNTLNEFIDNHGKDVLKNFKIEITEKNITSKALNPKAGSALKNLWSKDGFDDNFLDWINAVESFALFFVSGVAAEKVGFLTVGRTFCFMVGLYMPIIIIFSEDKYFANTMHLYMLWQQRLNKEELMVQKEKIDKKINDSRDNTILYIGGEK